MVRSGAYKQLLGDKIALLRQLHGMNIVTTLSALPGTLKPRLKDVSSQTALVFAFSFILVAQFQVSKTLYCTQYE